MAELYTAISSSTDPRIIEKDTKIGYFLKEVPSKEEMTLSFEVKENTSFELTFVDFTPSDINLNFDIKLSKGASATLLVAALDSGTNNKVFRGNVTHLEGETTSLTKMAGINSGSGEMRFLGSSLIVNGAHKSSTRQEAKITNLSPDAKSECSPALLIKENDVKASHGAALGAYDERELFYLMSRGLSLEESKRLITFGSLLPIIETLGDEKLIDSVKKELGGLSL